MTEDVSAARVTLDDVLKKQSIQNNQILDKEP